MGNEWEVYLTVFILTLWFLFPIGMFLSVSHLDKNTDQVIRLEKLRRESLPPVEDRPAPILRRARAS